MQRTAKYIATKSVRRVPALVRFLPVWALVACLLFILASTTAEQAFLSFTSVAENQSNPTMAQELPAPGAETKEKAVLTLPSPTKLQEIEEPVQVERASLSGGLSLFREMPFFLPTPEQKPAVSQDSAQARLPQNLEEEQTESLLSDFTSTPVLYEANARYTVEYNDKGEEIFRSTIKSGDAAGSLLNAWLPSAEVNQLVGQVNPVYTLASVRVGNPFAVVRDTESKAFLRFEYEVDGSSRLVVNKHADAPDFMATLDKIHYDVELTMVEGQINSSLFETVADHGEGPVLAVRLADVFSCEINFVNEIRQGDSFRVLVEKRFRDGEFKGYGNLLAAEFINQNRNFQAYLFPDAKGALRYYNEKGESLQRSILKAPLSFTRVSSGYSMARKHPIHRVVKPHQGVDYAAPSGTPILAVGDGVVSRAGWGGGYGNMVVIKHSNGLESQYAHMSGFAKNMKKGTKVRQGQTIGYVGATGTATGPHLDFRIKQNGNFVNPSKLIVPREAPLDKKVLTAFNEVKSLSLSFMESEYALVSYAQENWPALRLMEKK